MVSLMADFLVRISGVRWSFVVGTFDNRVIFSLRTKRRNQNAGLLARRMVKGLGTAGGHGMVGGGQIPTRGLMGPMLQKIREDLRDRFLRIMGKETTREERLIPDRA